MSTIGKVLLGTGVLLAHGQIAHERRIDRKVIHSFRTEHTIALFGLALIILGYFLEIYYFGFLPFSSCEGEACAASLRAILSQ